ncbi:MAG: SpoIIE family protein phosphatase [Clostridia bacterium]|nr:SpoIIE family protein phosphatase [Clostridia bacterium]
MTNKTNRSAAASTAAYPEDGRELKGDSAPMQDVDGAESEGEDVGVPYSRQLLRLGSRIAEELCPGGTALLRKRAVRQAVRRILFVLASAVIAALLCGARLAWDVRPLGLAFLCAASGGAAVASAAVGCLAALISEGGDAVLYLGGTVIAVGMRYAVGRFLGGEDGFGADKPRLRRAVRAKKERMRADTDGTEEAVGARIVRIGRGLLPSGVFTQSRGARVGIAVLSALPAAIGYLLSDAGALGLPASGAAIPACRALFVIAAVPTFTYLLGGLADGRRTSPAQFEAGVGVLCYALTASMGTLMLFGFSARLLCAHAMTLILARRHGYLRGAMGGLLCGFACDGLYAPAFAIVGGVFGLLCEVHMAAAVLLSLLGGGIYAVGCGEFAALRSVVPEMIVVSAAAYPILRYLPGLLPRKGLSAVQTELSVGVGTTTADPGAPTCEMLGITPLPVQLDALSGILHGLSATFYHLSDRTRKPGLYEIRQMCEGISDRWCASCAGRQLCWETDFSSTADAMGRITLCIHRKGRAENGAALSPLYERCQNLPNMLAAMNDAASHLCQEKMMRDKTETAACDYEGMADLLRATAEESVRAAKCDPVLSGRLKRAMERMGFSAEAVSVYGERRHTVIAHGVSIGGGGTSLLGTEELREAFSALSGVRYQPPEYSLSEGGRKLSMTMRAAQKIAVSCGSWGEKKAGEEVTGDVSALFANRSDHFYALVCDGMGSGREASVTAQISALFMEKLLSVSTAKGAALRLLNGFLRARSGECAATLDLCEIDMILGRASFVKCGAAPSYLIRGGELFRIASETMPLGILREVTAQETTVSLLGGDMLLFFSDGVCGDGEDNRWILGTVQASERAWHAKHAGQRAAREVASDGTEEAFAADGGREGGAMCDLPQYLAQRLGAAAAERVGRGDDRTVAVVCIKELV